MSEDGGEPLDSTISPRVSKTAMLIYESIPRGERGRFIDDSLRKYGAKDPKGLSLVLHGKAKQWKYHRAAEAALDADVRDLTKGRFPNIESFMKADGEEEAVQDLRIMQSRADVLETARRTLVERRARARDAGVISRTQELTWADTFLKGKGRTLNLTADELLKQIGGAR